MVSQAPSEAISVVATGLPPEQIEAEIVVLGVFADVFVGPDELSRGEPTDQASGCRPAMPLSSHLAAAFEGYRASGRTGAVGDDLVTCRRPGDEFAAGEVWWIGLGDPAGLTADALREVYTRLGRRVATAHHPVRTVAVVPPLIPGAAARDLSESSVLAAVVNGAADGLYRFERYRSTPVPPPATLLVHAGSPAAVAVTEQAAALARHTAWARDLINTPGGDLPPLALAEEVCRVGAAAGLDVAVRGVDQLRADGCGGILAVGAGSAQPPCLIEARYRGPGAKRFRVALVGKGITFDSGGLAIKRAEQQVSMKCDMAGGATVVAVALAAATLQLPGLDLHVLVPAAENMPSGQAVHPGDVIRHRNGVTSEVADPDCEGRLVLADALALAAEEEPDLIIDVATLTYACITALGMRITTALGNDAAAMARVRSAGAGVGEPIWELPLWQPYLPAIASPVADIRNEGVPNSPGAITAALFLQHFVDSRPWVHLDIGGTGYVEEPDAVWGVGATGVMVRTLTELLLRISQEATA